MNSTADTNMTTATGNRRATSASVKGDCGPELHRSRPTWTLPPWMAQPVRRRSLTGKPSFGLSSCRVSLSTPPQSLKVARNSGRPVPGALVDGGRGATAKEEALPAGSASGPHSAATTLPYAPLSRGSGCAIERSAAAPAASPAGRAGAEGRSGAAAGFMSISARLKGSIGAREYLRRVKQSVTREGIAAYRQQRAGWLPQEREGKSLCRAPIPRRSLGFQQNVSRYRETSALRSGNHILPPLRRDTAFSAILARQVRGDPNVAGKGGGAAPVADDLLERNHAAEGSLYVYRLQDGMWVFP